MNTSVLAEAIGPREGTALRVKQVVLVALGIVALAIAAKVKVPMWPVPITMGTFAVLTIGTAYGARLGLITMLGYLLVGALGFDVFRRLFGREIRADLYDGRHRRLSGRLPAGHCAAGRTGCARLGSLGW